MNYRVAFGRHKNSLRKRTIVRNASGDKRGFHCKKCESDISHEEFALHLYICPHCKEHYRMNAPRRIKNILDEGSFREMNAFCVSNDPLSFPEYQEKVDELGSKGIIEAVVTGTGKIDNCAVAVAVMDTRFFMGSMGVAVGEKLTQLIEYATRKKLPLILVCASGGARMQEGILSLMQMAKTSAAIEKHSQAGLLYISVLTNPTTGGVTASFASLGDIILAEPKALIGFAGPRVIEQTIGQTLPEGFQRAEYLLEHGFLDAIVERRDLRDTLGKILSLHDKQHKLQKRGNIL